MHSEIFTIFNPILAREARDLANMVPSARIIPVRDFPKGVAIHEDGTKRYDPKKPLAYFALELRSKRASYEWSKITKRFERDRAAALAESEAIG